jgi:hypothetical protein
MKRRTDKGIYKNILKRNAWKLEISLREQYKYNLAKKMYSSVISYKNYKIRVNGIDDCNYPIMWINKGKAEVSI